jgi:hypothetical protein
VPCSIGIIITRPPVHVHVHVHVPTSLSSFLDVSS